MRDQSLHRPLQRDDRVALLEGLHAREETQREDLLALVDYHLPALLLAQQDQL